MKIRIPILHPCVLAEREALAVQLIIRSGDGFRVLAIPQFESYLLR